MSARKSQAEATRRPVPLSWHAQPSSLRRGDTGEPVPFKRDQGSRDHLMPGPEVGTQNPKE